MARQDSVTAFAHVVDLTLPQPGTGLVTHARMHITALHVGLIALVAGCATDQPRETPTARLDLRQAMAVAAVDPVGVAIASNGERFVFDETLGLYRVDGDTAVAVVPMSALLDPYAPIRLPFTDLTSIAPGLFALTAIGDGFLLDTSAMTLTQHFCYEPGGLPQDFTQRTDAIAYDPELDRLYAQPRTLDDRGEFQGAQLAGYERATGVDIEWYQVDDRVAATAMTVVAGVGLIVGQGTILERFDVTTQRMSVVDDLARFGIRSIDGLAVDTVSATLVVVDRMTDELVEIELSQLSL